MTMLSMWRVKLVKDGELCDRPGCLQHLSHPYEGCGRIGGRRA